MADLIDLLIPKAHAQSDTIAQPTFGTITSGGSSTTSASILLSSDKTSVGIGGTFTIKVKVTTDTSTINQYIIVIDYDQTKLSVVDADTTTAGTQVTMLDSVFKIEDITTDNTVSSGRIRVNAQTSDGNPLSVNGDVVQIQFQAQTTGSTTIDVVQGVTGSQLVKSAGSTLGYTANEITVNVSSEQTSGDTDTDTNTDNNDGGTTTPITEIPNTAIADNIQVYITLGLGVLLLTFGMLLQKNKKREKQ